MHIITTLLALHLAAASPATLPSHSGRGVAEDSSKMTLVVVQNNRGVAVTVYAEYEWGEIKLGVVGADGQRTFQLSDRLVARSNVKLFIESPGQSEQETGFLDMNPGEQIDVIVPRR